MGLKSPVLLAANVNIVLIVTSLACVSGEDTVRYQAANAIITSFTTYH